MFKIQAVGQDESQLNTTEGMKQVSVMYPSASKHLPLRFDLSAFALLPTTSSASSSHLLHASPQGPFAMKM
jgi:hypothetical protein